MRARAGAVTPARHRCSRWRPCPGSTRAPWRAFLSAELLAGDLGGHVIHLVEPEGGVAGRERAHATQRAARSSNLSLTPQRPQPLRGLRGVHQDADRGRRPAAPWPARCRRTRAGVCRSSPWSCRSSSWSSPAPCRPASTCRSATTGAADAAAAQRSAATAHAARASLRIERETEVCMWIALLSRVVDRGRRQVSWLGARPHAFPIGRWPPSGWRVSAVRGFVARSQWRDRAGFTPDFPGHRPCMDASEDTGAAEARLSLGGRGRRRGRRAARPPLSPIAPATARNAVWS